MSRPSGDPARRAAEARERARAAGARAAELNAKRARRAAGRPADEGDWHTAQVAWVQSQEAARRAAQLAEDGFRHAATAERAAAKVHDTLADLLEQRSVRESAGRDELLGRAREHRDLAAEHRRLAAVDDNHGADPAPEQGGGRNDTADSDHTPATGPVSGES